MTKRSRARFLVATSISVLVIGVLALATDVGPVGPRPGLGASGGTSIRLGQVDGATGTPAREHGGADATASAPGNAGSILEPLGDRIGGLGSSAAPSGSPDPSSAAYSPWPTVPGVSEPSSSASLMPGDTSGVPLLPSTPGPSMATATPGSTVTPTPVPTPRPTATPGQSGWVTVINDQFDSGGVPSHWSRYDGPYGSSDGCAAPSHDTVSGGYLHLRLSYEPVGIGSANCGPGWYAGGLSLSGYSAVDQRVTVRFRVVRHGAAGHFIIPMRWPRDDSSWPAGGEEDYCESSDLAGCYTFLHYSASNQQIYQQFAVDLSQWHTIRTQRLDHVVKVYFDDMTTPVWTYQGSASTLPDTLKDVLLQQECQSSCPSDQAGTEDIQVDWITVADPA